MTSCCGGRLTTSILSTEIYQSTWFVILVIHIESCVVVTANVTWTGRN